MSPRSCPVFSWLSRGLAIGAALALAWLASAPLRAQGVKVPAALAKVPADAAAFVHVRPDFWKAEVFSSARDLLQKAGPGTLEAFNKRFTPPLTALDSVAFFLIPADEDGPAAPGVVLAYRESFDAAKATKSLLPTGKPKEFFGQRYTEDATLGLALKVLDNKTLLVSSPKFLARLMSHEAPPSGPMAAHFAAAGGHAVYAAANVEALPKDVWEYLPDPVWPLAGAKDIVASADAAKDLALKLRLRYADAAAAETAEAAFKSNLAEARKKLGESIAAMEKKLTEGESGSKSLVELPKMTQQLFELASAKSLDALLADPPFSRQGKALVLDMRFDPANPQTVAMGSGIAAGLLMPAVAKTREAAGRVRGQNNLRQLGLAMHNYQNKHDAFPAWAVYTKDGKKPLLSWRVSLLPFLGQEELYKQFKLDEPWDSEHNKKLIAKMPEVYAEPEAGAAPEPGMTHYQAFVGGGAGFRLAPGGIRFVDVTDGTSNTIMIATAANPVTWTRPEDLMYSDRKAVPKIGLGGKPASVALFDGSVRTLKDKTSDRTLRSAITAAGGELLGDDW